MGCVCVCAVLFLTVTAKNGVLFILRLHIWCIYIYTLEISIEIFNLNPANEFQRRPCDNFLNSPRFVERTLEMILIHGHIEKSHTDLKFI